MRKPIVVNQQEVVDIYDKYIAEHTYSDGIGKELEKNGRNPKYAYILYHYANELRKLKKWDIAFKEKWILEKQMAYLKMIEDGEYVKLKNEDIEKIKMSDVYEKLSDDVKEVMIKEKINELEMMQLHIFQKRYYGNKKDSDKTG